MVTLVGLLAYGYYLETYDLKYITRTAIETEATPMTGDYRSMEGCKRVMKRNGLTRVIQDTQTRFVGEQEPGSTMTCLMIGSGPGAIVDGTYSIEEPTDRALRAQVRMKQLARLDANSWSLRSDKGK